MRQDSTKNETNYLLRHNICLAATICMTFLGFACTSLAPDKGDASFNGIYLSHGVDDNADGFADHIDVGIGINVVASGNYKVLGTLYDDKGNETIPISRETNLTFGASSVTLKFYGIQQPGVYRLRNLTLHNDKGHVQDYCDEAYATEGYFSLDRTFNLQS